MALVPCRECGTKISSSAANCPSCGCPLEAPASRASKSEPSERLSEKLKDVALVLFIIAVVVVSAWVIVDQTVGRDAAAGAMKSLLRIKTDLNDETVTVPTDEFRGVLMKLPYDGEVTIEVGSIGGQSIDVHVIHGADLLGLANARPPFAARKLDDFPPLAGQAAPMLKRSHRLIAGTYVVVLEHSSRGAPNSDVKLVARLAP